MKQGAIIETVYNNVTGGRPNTDFSVMRVDIRSALPAAVNYVTVGDYWANLGNEGEREVPNFMITEKEYHSICKDSRGRDYIDVPDSLINVAGNGGVRYVEDYLGNQYTPRVQGSSNRYWDKVLNNKQYRYADKRIYLFNKPVLVDKLIAGLVLDSSNLKDDDEAPIPAGKEMEVINILTQLFTNQRMGYKDYIINGVDPVNSVKE